MCAFQSAQLCIFPVLLMKLPSVNHYSTWKKHTRVIKRDISNELVMVSWHTGVKLPHGFRKFTDQPMWIKYTSNLMQDCTRQDIRYYRCPLTWTKQKAKAMMLDLAHEKKMCLVFTVSHCSSLELLD